ncbi:TrmH family RNA methyltransferase [Candidatus Uabimicrobium amorphum]|uniref:TrmH family RNA methyltransferase n=1 Tax=Uabimicrobium amorphum TaxID=2596890 RepID=UPI001566EABE|nr:RNA methyltransferase [Candidatus Uabimicrobium amorphum]
MKQLHQKKYRRLSQEFLVEGIRICEELIASNYKVQQVYFNEELLKNSRGKKLLDNFQQKNVLATAISREKLAKLSTTTTPSPIIARAKQKRHELALGTSEKFVVLENVSDPGNVGTIIRTAEAFNWDAVILIGESVELYNPKIVRSTMGSLFRQPVFYSSIPNLLSCFEDMGVSYIVTSVDGGSDPKKIEVPTKRAVFLGSEAHGVSSNIEKKAHHKVQIPTQNVESLNIAIAGGILLYLYC